jgi:hypothetical protein
MSRLASAIRLRAAAYPALLIAGLVGTAGVTYGGPYAETSRAAANPSGGAPEQASAVTSTEVILPVEVMGPAGTTRSVSIDVPNPAGVDSMYLVGHALGYQVTPRLWNGTVQRDDKASYRVNGGPWRPISNAAANVRHPERAYLGIGGAFHTVRLTVPVSGIQAGTNTIEFRFNGTEGASSGYRILEIDLRAGTQSRIGQTTFIQDNPESWTAPAGGDVERGRIAWERRNSLTESAIAGAPMIVASCSDCHAYSGYDLKYFNFSNAAVEARAVFHGLTDQDGRDIAAYIRSVNLGRSDGRRTSPYARPWNPPYQPGPGLTARGEEDWAAGAGLEWVLDTDDETAYYLFPDGGGQTPNGSPSAGDIARAVRVGTWNADGAGDPGSFGARVPIQNTPVALQYPDWNNWLPDIHPLDAFGYADFTGTELWASHLAMYSRLDSPAEVQEAIQYDRAWITCTGGCARTGFGDIFFRVDYEFDDWPQNGLFDISYSSEPARYYLGKLSFMQWEAVKTWEVMNRFRLQDLGDELFGGLVTPPSWSFAGTPLRVTGSRAGQDTPFFWPGDQSVVFDMAPHKNAEPGFPTEGPYGPAGTQILQFYYSTVWYDLQLMLSRELAGWPASSGGGPIDWNYQTSLALDLQRSTGVSQWWRMFRARSIAVQSRNNHWAQRGSLNGGPAFTNTNANWWELFGHDPNNWTGWRAGDQVLARRAVAAALGEWFAFARSVPTEEWDRRSPDEVPGNGYEDATTVPQPFAGSSVGSYFDIYTDANNAYRLPPLLQSWGMEPELIDAVARWGESMWPLGNFEQWFSEVGTQPPPGPGGEEQVLTLGETTPNPFRTSVTIPYELSRTARVEVRIYDSLGRLVATVVDEEQDAGTHAPVFESAALPSGLYLCRVRAEDLVLTQTMVLAR